MIDCIDGFYIRRDDLTEGGTKRHALRTMIESMPETGFSYAGTVFGHGALALALAARDAGKYAYLYIAAPRGGHPMLEKLSASGSMVYVETGATVESLDLLARTEEKGRVLPPGFDMPEFDAALLDMLSGNDLSGIDHIWTSAVSGTLTRALQKAYPDKAFSAVSVVKKSAQLGRSRVFQAPEKYHRPAHMPPPYPACPYTDAKVWQFATAENIPHTLIWNTAG